MADLFSDLGSALEGVEPVVPPTRRESRQASLGPWGRLGASAYNVRQAITSTLTGELAGLAQFAGDIAPMHRTDLYGAAQELRDAGAYDEGFLVDGEPIMEPGLGTKVAGAATSALTFMAAGAGGKAIGAGAKMTSAGLGALLQSQAMKREAEMAGADEATQWKAFFGGAGIGMTEAVGLGGIAARVNKRSGGTFGNSLMAFARGAAAEAPEEGMQEAFQTFSEKILAQQVLEYATPEESPVLWGSIAEAFGLGALVGGGMGGGTHALGQSMKERAERAHIDSLTKDVTQGDTGAAQGPSVTASPDPAQAQEGEDLLASAAEAKEEAPKEAKTPEQAAEVLKEANNVPDATVRMLGEEAEQPPGTVFHSTTKDFDEFESQEDGDIGFHFGSKEQAEGRERQLGSGETSRTIAATLSVKNPLRLEDPNEFTASNADFRRGLRLAGVNIGPKATREEVIKAVEAAGYDGFVYENLAEGTGESVAALRPGQINQERFEINEDENALRELLTLVQKSGGKESTIPDIALVDAGQKLGSQGVAVGGSIALDAARAGDAMRGVLLHEVQHLSAAPGTPAFSEIVARARQEFPGLALAKAQKYETNFTEEKGHAPFRALAEGPQRDAALADEGFAQGAEDFAPLVETLLKDPALAEAMSVNEARTIRDWIVAVLNKIPGLNLKTTAGKARKALIDDLVTRELQEGASPEEILAFADALSKAIQSPSPVEFRKAAEQVQIGDVIAPEAAEQSAEQRPAIKPKAKKKAPKKPKKAKKADPVAEQSPAIVPKQPDGGVAEMPRTAPDMFGETQEKKGTRGEVVDDGGAQGAMFQEDTGQRGQASILDEGQGGSLWSGEAATFETPINRDLPDTNQMGAKAREELLRSLHEGVAGAGKRMSRKDRAWAEELMGRLEALPPGPDWRDVYAAKMNTEEMVLNSLEAGPDGYPVYVEQKTLRAKEHLSLLEAYRGASGWAYDPEAAGVEPWRSDIFAPAEPRKKSAAERRAEASKKGREQYSKKKLKIIDDPDSPFIHWLRAIGGVNDVGGDLANYTRKEAPELYKGVFSLPAIVRPTGKGLHADTIVRMMEEDGWIVDEFAEANNPIDTITDFIDRNPQRSDDAALSMEDEAAASEESQYEEEVQRLMEIGHPREMAEEIIDERAEAAQKGRDSYYGVDGDPLFSIAPPEDSAAFRKWFKDSKVVDENGRPLVVYHGTGGEDFTEFREEAVSRPGSGFGFHFAVVPAHANLYAEQADAGKRIMPVYLSIQNPADEATYERVKREARASLPIGVPRSPKTVERATRDALVEQGFDGLVYDDEVGGGVTGGQYPTVFVAFSPTQIKSATGNRGTFSSTDPDIRFSVEGGDKDMLFKESKFTHIDEKGSGVQVAGASLFEEWIADRQNSEEWAKSRSGLLERRLRKLMGKRSVKETVGEAFRGDSLRKVRDMDLAMHLYIDLGVRAEEEFAEFGDKLTAKQKRIYEQSQSLPKEIKALADQIRTENNERGKELHERGLIEGVILDYTARIWKPLEEGKHVGGNAKFTTTSPRFKRRGYSSILEGWSKDRALAVPSAISAQEISRIQTAQTIYDLHLREAGLKAGILSEVQRDGDEEIEHFGFKKWVHAGQAVPETVYGPDIRVDSEGTLWRRANIYAPKKLARKLNNALGSVEMGPWEEKFVRAQAEIKMLLLYTSLFHHQAFLRSFTLGTPFVKGPRDIDPTLAYGKGRENIEKYGGEVEVLVRNGLTLDAGRDLAELEDAEKTKIGKMIDKVAPAGAVKNALLAFRDQQTNFLFHRLGPYLKVRAALQEYRHLIHANRKALERGEITLDEVASIAASVANKDFGGLNLPRMGRSPKVQHRMRILLLAPDWTESNVKSMVLALTGGQGSKAKKRATRHAFQRMWARVAVRAGLMTVAANAIMAGFDDDKEDPAGKTFVTRYKRAWKEGNLRWMEVDITPLAKWMGAPRDSRYYFSILGHFRDPVKFVTHPIRSAGHKGAPLAKAGIDAITGTNWRGQRYTTAAELAGADDKGLYQRNGTRSDGTEYKKGDPKGGRMAGQSVTWDGRGGYLEYTQFPSFAIEKGVGMLPIQVQETMKYSMGEIDGFMALSKSLGFMTSVTRPTTPEEHMSNLEAEKKATTDEVRRDEIDAELDLWDEINDNRESQ